MVGRVGRLVRKTRHAGHACRACTGEGEYTLTPAPLKRVPYLARPKMSTNNFFLWQTHPIFITEMVGFMGRKHFNISF